MKVAISSKGSNLDAQVDPRFGRCQCFIIVDPATKAFEVLNNEAAAISGGAGIQAAQLVANAGVDAVVTGSVGPNAMDVLAAAGLKVYLGASGTVQEALQQIEEGQLQAASGLAAGGRPGTGGFGGRAAPGLGRGLGRGMGRGGGRGRGGGLGAGPVGDCICPSCGARVPHQAGVPCFEERCPRCRTGMRRYW